MEREIARDFLQANVGRFVKVTWSDGSNQVVIVINVDGEGFVYDLVPKDPKTAFWMAFDEEVQSIAAI